MKQRTLDQKRFAIELTSCRFAIERVGRIENPQLEQLACVVPFVERMTDVEPLVTLQANQIGVERSGGGRSQRRFADASLAFEEERPLQPKRQKKRNGQPVVCDVVLFGQPRLEVGNGLRNGDGL